MAGWVLAASAEASNSAILLLGWLSLSTSERSASSASAAGEVVVDSSSSSRERFIPAPQSGPGEVGRGRADLLNMPERLQMGAGLLSLEVGDAEASPEMD